MNTVWSKQIDEILDESGEFLSPLGINNWALSKRDMIYALTELKEIGISILGGDVYLSKENSFKPNYDNWFCERKEGEIHSEFVERSVSEAIHFIRNYSNTQKGNVYFTIVPEV